jgi:hypothetical protein
MPKCYIFAAGGTGSRVLESFTYLMAAGCGYETLKNWEIVPIIVDLDETNGNMEDCKNLMETYINIQRTLVGDLGKSCSQTIE